MGTDKALLPFHGGTLADSVAECVERAAGSAMLVGGGRRDTKTTWIPDIYPGEGPLGGILTALGHTTADWNLVVACDMPALSEGLLGALLDAAEQSGADIATACGPSGRIEPLCAVYHLRSRAALEQAFHRGIRKVTAAMEGLRVLRWNVSELACLENINTPEEWSAYAGN